MTGSIPNLWEGKVSTSVVTPLAILRTQAGNFDKEMKGLLRADVTSLPTQNHQGNARKHSFLIIAPGLHGYTREVLTAEHADPGAYPVKVESNFLIRSDFAVDPDYEGPDYEELVRTCRTQSDFLTALRDIFSAHDLVTELESLIAQINDANAED
jgi:hypothetical protein